jgi:hypothetical protein
VTSPRWPVFGAAILGFLWFLQLGGGPGLNPLHVDWLWSGDWRQHWLGFLFFQHDPWSFPLGQVSSLLYPVGTNIGFTDSNPLLAIAVKPFARWLPYEYQLVGLWLAACFTLQGYAGAKLASTVTKDAALQLLGGYLIVLSPVLAARLGHDTLCAQFIPVGLLYLGLREYSDSAQASRAARWVVALVMLSAGIHPYLAAMSWVLGAAVLLRFRTARLMSPLRSLAWVATTAAGLASVWAIVGYFGHTPDGSTGFGEFSADLLSLVDPRDYSKILPPIPTTNGEWEGVGFVGLGGLLSAVAGVALLVRRRRPTWRPGLGFPVGACVLLFIYALSVEVKFAGTEVATLGHLYGPLKPFIQPFRSSGRFVWPLSYLMLTFGIWGVTRLFGREDTRKATAAMAIVVALQAGDLRVDRWWLTHTSPMNLMLMPFEPSRGHYKHLALAPAQVMGACGDKYDEDYVYRFMLLAHRLGLTFNSGIYARLDKEQVHAACEAQNRSVTEATLDPETIYIPSAKEMERFKTSGKAVCSKWDGNWICVSRDSNQRYVTFIETGKDPG